MSKAIHWKGVRDALVICMLIVRNVNEVIVNVESILVGDRKGHVEAKRDAIRPHARLRKS